jgi:hypothetical protein
MGWGKMASGKIKQLFSPRDDALFPITVETVHVAVGASVTAGDALLTFRTATEKTLVMRTPLDGVVETIGAGTGDMLARPRVLVTVAQHDEAPAAPEQAAATPAANPGEASAPAGETSLGDWEISDPDPVPTAAKAAPRDTAAPQGTASPGAPAASASGSARKPLVAAIAVVAALGLGYVVFAPAPSSPPEAAPQTKTAAPATSKPAAKPAAQPASYSGPLSRARMLARDLGDRTLGWASQGNLLGHGILRIEKDGAPSSCPAVLISKRYAIFSRMCLDPKASSNQREEGAHAYFETIRPFRARSGKDWKEVSGFWNIWQLDVKALHFWKDEVVDGSPSSIGVAELAETAPGRIGFAGHWRITSQSAPGTLDLRSYAAFEPSKYYSGGVTCRYWLHHNASRADDTKGLPLTVDPDCEDVIDIRSGAFEVRYTNGKDYLGGFFRIGARDGKPSIFAVSFSKSDDAIIRGAKDGKLPGGWITISPTERHKPDDMARFLLANPCSDGPTEFNVIATDTKTGDKLHTRFTQPSQTYGWSKADIGRKFDRIAMSEFEGSKRFGTSRVTLRDKTFEALEVPNKPGFKMLIESECLF